MESKRLSTIPEAYDIGYEFGYRKAKEETLPKSFKYKLPEQGEKIILFSQDRDKKTAVQINQFDINWLSDENWIYIVESADVPYNNATHWLPIPSIYN
jgi:hypothetical protein